MKINTNNLYTIERDGVQYYPQYVFSSTAEAEQFLLSEGYEDSDIEEFDIVTLHESLEALAN